MTAQVCLFCASREQGGGALKVTGRTQSKPSRWHQGELLRRYELRCATCGYRWWFAGRWAAEQYAALIEAQPGLAQEEAPPPPPPAAALKQPLLPEAPVRQCDVAGVGQLAHDWKRKQAQDDAE